MGQYFLAANVDKNEWLQDGSFSKLTESAWILNDFVRTVEHLLYGEWFGDRVLWAGDYMEHGRFLPEDIAAQDPEVNLYSHAINHYKKRRLMKKTKYFRYLVNHSKMEFVDKDKVRENDGWKVHPLPILTAASNGKGGGDYYGKTGKEYVGSWCGDCIAVSHEHPGGTFKEIVPDFYE